MCPEHAQQKSKGCHLPHCYNCHTLYVSGSLGSKS